MRKVLIPTHGSPSARCAAEVGLTMAAAEGADVTLLHVVAPTQWSVRGRDAVCAHAARRRPASPRGFP